MYLGHLCADKTNPVLIYGTSGHIIFQIPQALLQTPVVDSMKATAEIISSLEDFIHTDTLHTKPDASH